MLEHIMLCSFVRISLEEIPINRISRSKICIFPIFATAKQCVSYPFSQTLTDAMCNQSLKALLFLSKLNLGIYSTDIYMYVQCNVKGKILKKIFPPMENL